MDKVKKWSDITLFEKIATITAFSIVVAYILLMILWLCGVVESIEGIGDLLVGIGWLLLGMMQWRVKKKLAIVLFVLSGLKLALAFAYLFL